MNIEGVPEGWELVRIGRPGKDDMVLNGHAQIVRGETYQSYMPIVKKIEKPKRYRPFASAEEFRPFRDKWIQSLDNDGCWKVIGYNSNSIYLEYERSETYVDAFGDYVFEDGQPFGIEVTE